MGEAVGYHESVTDDVVKVEIWDVVDKGKSADRQNAQAAGSSTTAKGAPTGASDLLLDAATVDVYKTADCVVFIYDPCKRWTFDYVARMISSAPAEKPVLILANFRDMADKHAVTRMEGEGLAAEHASRSGGTYFAEASMRDGFGLKFIHRFLNIPYLTLQVASGVLHYRGGCAKWRGRTQRQVLERQLADNEREFAAVSSELEIAMSTPEQDYDKFLAALEAAKAKAAATTSAKAADVGNGQTASLATTASGVSQPAGTAPHQVKGNAPTPAFKSTTPADDQGPRPSGGLQPSQAKTKKEDRSAAVNKDSHSSASDAANNKGASAVLGAPAKEASKAKSSANVAESKEDAASQKPAARAPMATGPVFDPTKPVSVDNFVPPVDGGDLDSFFTEQGPAAADTEKKSDKGPGKLVGFFKSAKRLVRGGPDTATPSSGEDRQDTDGAGDVDAQHSKGAGFKNDDDDDDDGGNPMVARDEEEPSSDEEPVAPVKKATSSVASASARAQAQSKPSSVSAMPVAATAGPGPGAPAAAATSPATKPTSTGKGPATRTALSSEGQLAGGRDEEAIEIDAPRSSPAVRIPSRATPPTALGVKKAAVPDSDDDDDGGNPMVARDADVSDDEDELPPVPRPAVKPSARPAAAAKAAAPAATAPRIALSAAVVKAAVSASAKTAPLRRPVVSASVTAAPPPAPASVPQASDSGSQAAMRVVASSQKPAGAVVSPLINSPQKHVSDGDDDQANKAVSLVAVLQEDRDEDEKDATSIAEPLPSSPEHSGPFPIAASLFREVSAELPVARELDDFFSEQRARAADESDSPDTHGTGRAGEIDIQPPDVEEDSPAVATLQPAVSSFGPDSLKTDEESGTEDWLASTATPRISEDQEAQQTGRPADDGGLKPLADEVAGLDDIVSTDEAGQREAGSYESGDDDQPASNPFLASMADSDNDQDDVVIRPYAVTQVASVRSDDERPAPQDESDSDKAANPFLHSITDSDNDDDDDDDDTDSTVPRAAAIGQSERLHAKQSGSATRASAQASAHRQPTLAPSPKPSAPVKTTSGSGAVTSAPTGKRSIAAAIEQAKSQASLIGHSAPSRSPESSEAKLTGAVSQPIAKSSSSGVLKLGSYPAATGATSTVSSAPLKFAHPASSGATAHVSGGVRKPAAPPEPAAVVKGASEALGGSKEKGVSQKPAGRPTGVSLPPSSASALATLSKKEERDTIRQQSKELEDFFADEPTEPVSAAGKKPKRKQAAKNRHESDESDESENEDDSPTTARKKTAARDSRPGTSQKVAPNGKRK